MSDGHFRVKTDLKRSFIDPAGEFIHIRIRQATNRVQPKQLCSGPALRVHTLRQLLRNEAGGALRKARNQ